MQTWLFERARPETENAISVHGKMTNDWGVLCFLPARLHASQRKPGGQPGTSRHTRAAPSPRARAELSPRVSCLLDKAFFLRTGSVLQSHQQQRTALISALPLAAAVMQLVQLTHVTIIQHLADSGLHQPYLEAT